jgi:hypothetical protein
MIKTIGLYSLVLMGVLLASFVKSTSLKGTWQYRGGVANGKVDGPPKGYTLQRVYTDNGYSAYVIQKGYKTEKYEMGTYRLSGDTCFETTTFSSHPSQLMGKTVAYIYTVKAGVLTLSAKLPSGMVAVDKWAMITSKKK